MDLYVVLGLERTATVAEIKRAYRRLARRYHPDVNPGDRMAAAQFQRIVDAYETLVDPDRRQHYDAVGTVSRPDPAAFGFEGFDFSVSVSGASAPTFGDLFADVFHQRAVREDVRTVGRGADLHHSVTIGFENAVRGGDVELAVTREEACSACRGTGRVQGETGRCGDCQGTGAVRSARGHMVFSKPCGPCGGTGRLRPAVCPACRGHRTEMRSERLRIPLPPGLTDGARIRVAGKGHAGRNGGEPGDLYVDIRIMPHPLFRREGDDLHVTVPVAVHEAALGAKIDVPSLDGPVRLRVPPGTQSGQRLRLHERGVPSPHTGRRGDLIVEVRLVLPALLDERSKELMREFGRINGEDVRRTLIERQAPSDAVGDPARTTGAR